MYHQLEDTAEDMGGLMVRALPAWKQLVLVFLPSLIAFVALDITWIALVAGQSDGRKA
jgi:hypothetical protein